MSKQLSNELHGFVTKNWPVRDVILNKDTRLQEDLGIKGDDANEFIYLFSITFKIDVTNLDLSNYFNGSDFNLIAFIFQLFRKHGPINKKKKELTLGDLDNALTTGSLDDNVLMQVDTSKDQ